MGAIQKHLMNHSQVDTNSARNKNITYTQHAETLIAYGTEPTTYEEATKSDCSKEWYKAMKEEIDAQLKNNTWEMCELPAGREAIKCKWVHKKKMSTNGTIERYKARLVAKGYTQKFGIDHTETFSPVVRLDTIRIILAIVAKEDLEMAHLDIKTAFLHGDLEESIYMQQPEGFESNDKKVCKLKKAIYGLKQASRNWNLCFTQFLQ